MLNRPFHSLRILSAKTTLIFVEYAEHSTLLSFIYILMNVAFQEIEPIGYHYYLMEACLWLDQWILRNFHGFTGLYCLQLERIVNLNAYLLKLILEEFLNANLWHRLERLILLRRLLRSLEFLEILDL
jgi:hypothetical protein